MALTEEKRTEIAERIPEIVERYQAGTECKEIAAEMNVPPLVIWKALEGEGIEMRPSQSPRRKKRKDSAPSVEPLVPPMPPLHVLADSPLFPRRPDSEIDRIQVIRRIARPASARTGILPDLDPEATEQDIMEAYGGGRYELRAFNAKGRLTDRRSVKILGASKPVEADEAVPEEDTEYMPASDPSEAVLRELAETRRMMMAILEKSTERERSSLEDRLALERQMAKERAAEQAALHSAMMQMQQAGNAQMMQLLIQAQSGSRSASLRDRLEELAMLREVTGGGGGGEGRGTSAITELIRQAPDLLAEGAKLVALSKGAPPSLVLQPEGEDDEDEGDEDDTNPRQKLPPAPVPGQPTPAPPAEPSLDDVARQAVAVVAKEKGVPSEVVAHVFGNALQAIDHLKAEAERRHRAKVKKAAREQAAAAAPPEPPPEPNGSAQPA